MDNKRDDNLRRVGRLQHYDGQDSRRDGQGRKGLNTVRDDNGENDDIIYALSISTVVKKSTLALVE